MSAVISSSVFWLSFQNKSFKLLQEKGETEIDLISYAIDIPLGILSSKLLNLEFEGIVKSLPGKKFKLLV